MNERIVGIYCLTNAISSRFEQLPRVIQITDGGDPKTLTR